MMNYSLIRKYVVGLFLLAMTLSAAPTTGIDRLAVVDFEISGDVGIPDAGRSVAALLLPKFGSRYQLVERMQLAKILAEHDLAIADIAKNPALLRGKTIEGVQFLVLGTVAKLGSAPIPAFVAFNRVRVGLPAPRKPGNCPRNMNAVDRGAVRLTSTVWRQLS